ncbi:MAG: trypsin-like serine protease [Bdellovibrionota bacterium]
MINKFLLLALLFLVGCGFSQKPWSINSSGDKIVGGEAVAATDPVASHTVNMFQITNHVTNEDGSTEFNFITCSGVIIDKNVIMTAAHCFKGNGGVHIKFGLSADFDDSTVLAKSFVLHPQYKMGAALTEAYDVALIFIDQPLPANYKPVSISKDVLQEGTPLTPAGFGQHVHAGVVGTQATVELRKVNLTGAVVPGIGKTEFAVHQLPNQGIGQGDSGGPVYIKKSDRLELVGINSRAVTYEGDQFPTLMVFAQAKEFIPWIKAETAKVFPPAAPVAAPIVQNPAHAANPVLVIDNTVR